MNWFWVAKLTLSGFCVKLSGEGEVHGFTVKD